MNKLLVTGLLSVFFFFTVLSIYCQINEGYIVTKSNDTIKGFVFDGTNYKNTKYVKFKPNKNENYTLYKPEELLGYGIAEHEVYKSIEVSNVIGEDSILFIKEILKGNVSLYIGTSKQGVSNYYIRKGDSSVFLLKKDVYLGLLKINLNKCDKVDYNSHSGVKKVGYNKQKLINFISDYNNCIAPNSTNLIRKENKVSYSRGLKIGINNSTYDVTFPVYQRGKYSNLGFDAGAYLNFPFNNSMAIQVEALYSFRAGKGEKTISFPTAGYYTSNHDFAFHFLNVPLLLNLKLPGSKIRPFINVGPNVLIKLGKSGSSNTDLTNYSGVMAPDTGILLDTKYNKLKSFSLGFTSGVGLNILSQSNRSVSLELRYSYNFLSSVGTTGIADLKTPAIMLGFGF